jgi:general secretion pathway protein H
MENLAAKKPMRISATGTWTNSARGPVCGFTLIELLVVLLIIGIMIGGTVLSVRVSGGDRELNRERDRILALTDYLREQATLQNREYGMRGFIGGYEFLVFDSRTGQWLRLEGDSETRTRRLPVGIGMKMRVEGREIILPKAEVEPDELAPQILLFSSGELNLFELILQRNGGDGVSIAPSPVSERIEAVDLVANPA